MPDVDKTAPTEDILSKEPGRFLFTRPARFGKSTNLGMPDAYPNVQYPGNTWFDVPRDSVSFKGTGDTCGSFIDHSRSRTGKQFRQSGCPTDGKTKKIITVYSSQPRSKHPPKETRQAPLNFCASDAPRYGEKAAVLTD